MLLCPRKIPVKNPEKNKKRRISLILSMKELEDYLDQPGFTLALS